MEAGRELDALIAEKVMGWSSQADGLYWDAGNHRTRLVLGSIIAKKRDEMGLENAHGFVFAPSTNIADAWEVVRKMGMVLIENSGEAFGKLDEWNVQFVGHDKEGEPHWVSESAETVELAICLAALKAKEVTGEQHG
jgi:hypothetical protein